MNLADLISSTQIRLMAQPGQSDMDLSAIRICDLTEDSRTVVPGSLFIARKGTSTDGNRYIEPALTCGCVAILTDQEHIELPPRSKVAVLVSDDVPADAALLAERFYHHASSALIIAGVTGTNGKTTITHLAQQLIESANVRCGLIGTVEIDDGRERARAAMTTPPSIEISRSLATMVEHGCKAVVMEVSSHALDQSRVAALTFDAAAFTNLTGDHLDYHHTIESYAQAKSKLFAQLDQDGVALINIDDPNAQTMRAACPSGVQVIECTTSKDKPTSSTVEVIDETIQGMSLRINTPIGQIESCVPIFGAFNAMNILQSVLLAQQVMSKSGLNPQEQLQLITEALPDLDLPQGRFEHVESNQDDLTVLVDFAHTDGALTSALGAIRKVLPDDSKLWCVFGCGGDRDKTKRARMGKAAVELADSIVITSDNPRTEPPNAIIKEIMVGINDADRTRVNVQSDRSQAIDYAINHAEAHDVILIAGKGHETEQISPDASGGVRIYHFDDREHARISLRKRRLRGGGSRADQSQVESAPKAEPT
jgi:UDP-N-acetylmuramoyl-L-alanyl-D-glutamate--2,6-diaminopimelate ligase